MPIELRRLDNGKQCWFAYDNYWPSVPVKIKDDAAVKLAIELEAYRVGLTEEQGGKGKVAHFRTICSWLWPSFDWHDWSIRLAKGMIENAYCGITGCASSGKSGIFSKYALVEYISNPEKTLVFVLTTSVRDAETRIWSDFTRSFNAMVDAGISGFKLVQREHYIGFKDPTRGAGRGSAINLVAAADEFREDALKKLQGNKNQNVIVLFDEAQDCSAEVFAAVLNLRKNPRFEFKCAGNAAKPFDPHGIFCTPVNGWNSISVEDEEWEIEVNGARGKCIHLDGMKSPNIAIYNATGEDKYLYLYKGRDLEQDLILGEKNPAFWRQCRGFWPPSGVEEDIIFPAADLQKYGALDRQVSWINKPIGVIGVDPAFGGGDRFMLHYVKYGPADDGQYIIYDEKSINLKIEGSTEDSSQSRNMVLKVKAIAEELGVPPKNVGVDAGSGDIILDAFHDNWSRDIMAVHFGGAASEMEYTDERGKKVKCKDVFYNRSSELWYVVKLFLRAGQIRGLSAETAREASLRKYGYARKKIKIEPKPDLRERTNGKSTDDFDAFVVAVEVLRQRFGAVPGKVAKQQNIWTDIFGKKPIDKKPQMQLKSLSTMQSNSPKGGSLSGLVRINSR